ncbi:MAG: sulfatase [Phycisphaerales bacterium]|nr:MAG: sulfatase [Phycisphaerales bacterium]
MNRRNFLRYAGLAAASVAAGRAVPAASTSGRRKQPNFLIIMADDCTYSDLPVYGGQNAVTPNIDRLASESLVFNRAYLASAMCQPCRAELYSGLYPMRNGCAWNHSASRPDITTMPHHLSTLGYRVGLAGKVHVKPDKVFAFTRVGGFDTSCTRNPTRPHNLQPIRNFMQADESRPFCLVVALVEPHVPWVMGDASKYTPKKLKLPANIADTPTTRGALGRYLAEITYMDNQVGQILQTLEKSGRADNTLVLFTSEQGAQFPGCKWTNWDTGLHTALIARWPGRIAPGKRTGALVQYCDVLPTLVDAAGGEAAAHDYDGTSFLPVLLGKTPTHRRFVYGMHNNIPEGPAYPVRTVSDGQYRYIRNLRPDEIYIEKHLMGWAGRGELNNPYWATWVRDAWNDPRTYNLVKRYMHRPAEQLYHTAEDPYELNNLADDPGAAGIKARLSAELDRWMKQQGDPGAPQDTHEAIEAARRGEHKYGARPGA